MSDLTDLRLAALHNGYSPLPNLSKACLLKGWPTLDVTEDEIRSWESRKSPAKRFVDTGLRVENGLAVIDLDINHEVVGAVAAAIEEKFPQLLEGLVRYGKGHKEAWFVRTSEPFTRLHTRRWLAPEHELERDGAQVVEIFGGGSPRQFGAVGSHTRSEDGSSVIEYQWAEDKGPWNTPLQHLPELTKADFLAILDLAEQVMQQAGFSPEQRSTKGESEVTRAYDLTADMVFECNDNVSRTLDELDSFVSATGEEGLRCSASWLEPGAGHSLTRCLIGRTHSGALNIWDAGSHVSHMRADLAPVEHEKRQASVAAIAERLKRLAEVEGERKARAVNEIKDSDDHEEVAAKLTQTYAFCKGRHAPVIPIWTDTIEAGFSVVNFRQDMQPNAGTVVNSRGTEKSINPVDLWMKSKSRVSVEGVQLRPDKPRPLFTDDKGGKWVNAYTPAVHPGGGRVDEGLELLEQLLPDPAERAWYTQWLAYKWLNPHIPGPAVIMVAKQFGTGRGTLGELLRRMFGGNYVRTLSFDTFAGRTYQSQYNDWGADSLMVLVNESSTSDGTTTYKAKHDTYERLKELVDPRPIVRHFVVKKEKAFYAPSFTTFQIATNNPDALPLPADDRRFWVGTNGDPREPEFWERIGAWMDVPENVGAFVEWLEATDLSGYSPFAAPPMTDAKRAMTEMSSSDIDRGFDIVMANLTAGDVMVTEQIIAGMRQAAELYGFEYPDKWQAIVKRMVSTKMERVGVTKGQNWFPQIEGKRYAVYAKDKKTARKWTTADAQDLRVEILRNGSPSSTGLGSNVLAGMFKQATE